MKQEEFVQRYQAQWRTLEAMLDALEKRSKRAETPVPLEEYPFLYRRVCQQLALARDRDYAAHVIDRLNLLVLRGHQHLYQSRAGLWPRIAHGAAVDFPRRVRAEARLFCAAALLLFGPTLGIAWAVVESPDLVYAVMSPSDVDLFEEMYRPDGEHFGRQRSADTDFLMFGYYIRNNIGIAFQVFAGGILYGLGSAFFLVFNGLHFGAVAGHLTNVGFWQPFYSFVVGHGAFELTAIVLAGMAGLKLGWGLIAPGRLPRARALREAARECVVVICGVFVMLVLAAFIEAFWSSSTFVPYAAKYAVGALFWLIVAVYFTLVGREHGPQ